MEQNIDTKALFAPKKGKQATKGQKEIYKGNQETLRFYSIMTAATVLPKLVFSPMSTTTNLVMILFSILVQSGCLGGMLYMSKPVISGSSQTIVDGGIDLNMKGGFADYLKDIIITTVACTLLSLFSNGFWALWLWLPAFFIYKIWMSVLAPWFFAPAPEDLAPEVADKKRKKMERKMARQGNYR